MSHTTRGTHRWRAFALREVSYFMTIVALFTAASLACGVASIALPAILTLVRRRPSIDGQASTSTGSEAQPARAVTH